VTAGDLRLVLTTDDEIFDVVQYCATLWPPNGPQ
jgi:hypothetical protein